MIWKIPVTWEMCAYINVEAGTLGKAMRIARDEAGTIPLPRDSANYVDGSWGLSSEDEDYLLSLQKAEVAATHETNKRSADYDC